MLQQYVVDSWARKSDSFAIRSTIGDKFRVSLFSLRETLNFVISKSSNLISLINLRIIFDEYNSRDLYRFVSYYLVKIVVELDHPVTNPELLELLLFPLSLSGHRLGPIYPFKPRVRDRIPRLSFSATSGD